LVVDSSELGEDVFRPHGRYEAHIGDGLVRSQVQGPLNCEMMELYRKRALPLYREAARDGRFCVLAQWRISMLMSPQTIDVYTGVLKEFMRKVPEFTGVAYVAGPAVEGRAIMSQLLKTRCFDAAGMPFRIFDEAEPAEAWLRELLAGSPRELQAQLMR
jgi:hypothetical protein